MPRPRRQVTFGEDGSAAHVQPQADAPEDEPQHEPAPTPTKSAPPSSEQATMRLQSVKAREWRIKALARGNPDIKAILDENEALKLRIRELEKNV